MIGKSLVRRASFRANPNEMVKLYSGPSPFEIFTKMSNQLGTFNFGHGSPDSHPPQFLKDALVAAMNDTKNQHQYCRPLGHPEFAAQIAEEFSPSFERKLDPVWEISTGVGATGMIANTLYAFLKPADEMVCFEPSFLGYAPLFHIVGPKVNWVNFRTNKQTQKFEFDREAFRRAVNSKTKIVFLNNPHNPAGHLFSREELEFIADTVRQYPDIIVIADEVYEKFVFGGRKFTRFATLPDMWERTVSIYSSGKVFSCTGWRVGFSIAPSYLTKQIGSWQTWSVYCMNTLSAKAVELGMKHAVLHPYEGYPNYYEWLRSTFEWRANEISKIVRASPLNLKVLQTDPDVRARRRLLHRGKHRRNHKDDAHKVLLQRPGQRLRQTSGSLPRLETARPTRLHA